MPSAVEHMGRPLRTQRRVGGEGHTWAGVPGPCGLSLRTGMAGLAWGGEYRCPPRGSLPTKLARAAFWAARSSRLVVAASPWSPGPCAEPSACPMELKEGGPGSLAVEPPSKCLHGHTLGKSSTALSMGLQSRRSHAASAQCISCHGLACIRQGAGCGLSAQQPAWWQGPGRAASSCARSPSCTACTGPPSAGRCRGCGAACRASQSGPVLLRQPRRAPQAHLGLGAASAGAEPAPAAPAERQLDRESLRADEAERLSDSTTGSSLAASAWLPWELKRLLAMPPVCSLVRSCARTLPRSAWAVRAERLCVGRV